MFRQILHAIAAALSRGLSLISGLLKGFVLLPFSLFNGGDSLLLPVDTTAIRGRMAAPGEMPDGMVKSQIRDATICWAHINGSLGDRKMRPMPPALSKKTQSWLAGLNYGQLLA